MKPVHFPESNNVLLGSQDQDVSDLPIHRTPDMVISCWDLNEHEMAEVVKTHRVWLLVLGQTHPPMKVTGSSPFPGVQLHPGDVAHEVVSAFDSNPEFPRVEELVLLAEQWATAGVQPRMPWGVLPNGILSCGYLTASQAGKDGKWFVSGPDKQTINHKYPIVGHVVAQLFAEAVLKIHTCSLFLERLNVALEAIAECRRWAKHHGDCGNADKSKYWLALAERWEALAFPVRVPK